MRKFAHIALLGVAVTLAPALLAPSSTATPPRHGKSSKSHTSKHTVSAAEAQAAAARKEQLRQKMSHLNRHMHDVKVKIHEAKVKENQIHETIGQVQTRMDSTKETLHRVTRRLTQLTNEHVVVIARLERTQDHLASRRRLLASRLLENYERGQATYAQVLIQSRSVHELLSRGYYVRQIVHSDANLVKSVEADVRQIQIDKRHLEAQAREEQVLENQYESQKEQYASDLDKKHALLANVVEVREQAQDELDELESESNAMADRIRALSELLRQRREAQQREARRRAQAGNKHHTAPPKSEDAIPPVWHGGFIRPCPGRVTSGFGMRFHPILHRTKLHTGVDLGAPYGCPIHAAAGGVVLLASYTRGYGNCVIIDHGGGVTTLYGHCSALAVSEGQNVKQGQVIGRVGATGYATGPHLHFEVRHNGTPVPPGI